MRSSKLEVGQEVFVTVGSMFYKDNYQSHILSTASDSFEISMPFCNGINIPIYPGFIIGVKVTEGHAVTEFFTKVIDQDKTRNSLLLKIPEESMSRGKNGCKFITVASGKGGVGKTSFTINYAIALAKKGKRVVIFDADFGMANVDVLFKLKPENNILDLIDGIKSMNEIIISAPGNIKLIPGASGIQELANLTDDQFEHIMEGFEFLERNFDYVLIDTGAGLSKNVTNFILSTHETIIVTTPEPHAITDAYSIIKVALTNRPDVTLKLIVNKCETIAEGQNIINKMTKVARNFLNNNLIPLGCIPESKVVSRSIKEQTPYYITYPNSEPTKSIDFLANCEIGCKLYMENPTSKYKSLDFISKILRKFQNFRLQN